MKGSHTALEIDISMRTFSIFFLDNFLISLAVKKFTGSHQSKSFLFNFPTVRFMQFCSRLKSLEFYFSTFSTLSSEENCFSIVSHRVIIQKTHKKKQSPHMKKYKPAIGRSIVIDEHDKLAQFYFSSPIPVTIVS